MTGNEMTTLTLGDKTHELTRDLKKYIINLIHMYEKLWRGYVEYEAENKELRSRIDAIFGRVEDRQDGAPDRTTVYSRREFLAWCENNEIPTVINGGPYARLDGLLETYDFLTLQEMQMAKEVMVARIISPNAGYMVSILHDILAVSRNRRPDGHVNH